MTFFVFTPFIEPVCVSPDETYYIQLDGFVGTNGSGFLDIAFDDILTFEFEEACVTRIINDGNDATEFVVLNPTTSGGSDQYTYEWTLQDGTAIGHCNSLSVQPMETTTYIVTVTDSCQSVTASVEVQVVDISCGNKKVKICHIPPGNPDKKHEICVSEKALDAHLAHGDMRAILSRATRDRHAHLSREVDETRNKIHFTFITLHDINTSAILQSTHACLPSCRFKNPEKDNCIYTSGLVITVALVPVALSRGLARATTIAIYTCRYSSNLFRFNNLFDYGFAISTFA